MRCGVYCGQTFAHPGLCPARGFAWRAKIAKYIDRRGADAPRERAADVMKGWHSAREKQKITGNVTGAKDSLANP